MNQRLQPEGKTWEQRAQLEVLQAVLDPADIRGFKNQWIDALHKRVLGEYLLTSQRILDVGCGKGRFTSWMADQAALVVGIDITKTMIEAARRQISKNNIRFLISDGTALPFRQGSFDVVLSVGVLQFLNSTDLETVSREMTRVLTEDGRIFLIEQVSRDRIDAPRLPEEYINVFMRHGCRSVVHRPVRRGRSLLVRLISRGMMPRYLFPVAIEWELKRSRRASLPGKGYLDYLVVFQKARAL